MGSHPSKARPTGQCLSINPSTNRRCISQGKQIIDLCIGEEVGHGKL
jgi:hypothetical protein